MSKYYLNESDRGIIDTTIRKVDYYSGRMTPEEGLPPGGGDTYKGYFKVTNSSTTKVQQLNIAEGVCLINDTWFTVATDDVPITASGYIYLESEYTPAVEDDVGNIMTNGVVNTPVFLFSAGIPTYSDTHFRVIIATVTTVTTVTTEGGEEIEVESITGFIQQNHGMILGYIFDKLAEDISESEAMDKRFAEVFCNTYNSICTGGKCSSKGNTVEKTVTREQTTGILEGDTEEQKRGKTRAQVSTEIAKYTQTGVDIACKSKESGTYNGGQCGSGKIYDAKPLNAINSAGTTYSQTIFYCCCEDAPDEEEECVTCSEQNATCIDPAHPDCEARGTATQSAVYASYPACTRNRNYATSSSALDKACRDLDTGDPNTGYYYCCHTSSSDCTGSDESWTYTRSLCCCIADCDSTTEKRIAFETTFSAPDAGGIEDAGWLLTNVGKWTNPYPCTRHVKIYDNAAYSFQSRIWINGDPDTSVTGPASLNLLEGEFILIVAASFPEGTAQDVKITVKEWKV